MRAAQFWAAVTLTEGAVGEVELLLSTVGLGEGALVAEALRAMVGELVWDLSLHEVAATKAAPLPLASLAVMNFTSAAGARMHKYS